MSLFEDDRAPSTHDDSMLICAQPGCGNVLEYSGKGRKPKWCGDHKPSTSGTASGNSRGRASSASVTQAAETVDSLYSMIGLLLMGLGANDAASAIAGGKENVRRQNEKFLANDPALVKMINKAGGAGGRTMFIVTNTMFIAPIVATAYREVKPRIDDLLEPKTKPAPAPSFPETPLQEDGEAEPKTEFIL